MKIIKIQNRHFVFELNSNIYKYGFFPKFGINLVFNWMKNEEQFGLYIHLIILNIYFDWFLMGQ
jgi:hypothetical protein